jgi:hypothetical protein
VYFRYLGTLIADRTAILDKVRHMWLTGRPATTVVVGSLANGRRHHVILEGQDNDGQATQSEKSGGEGMLIADCVLGVTWPLYVASCATKW